MTRNGMLISVIACLLSNCAATAQVATDGQHQPPLVEGAYTFDCGNFMSRIRWQQERRPLTNDVSPERALRVSLLELSVHGRSVSASDLAAATDRFNAFAWIERVEALCFAGEVHIFVKGMPLGAWLDHLNREGAERPDPVTTSFRVSRSGNVVISSRAASSVVRDATIGAGMA